jgi:hypothetical protein
MMRKREVNFLLPLIILIFFGLFLNLSVLYSKPNKPKKHSKAVSRKQMLIQESLKKLKTYFIGYDNISFENINHFSHAGFSSFDNIFSTPYFKDKLISNILQWLGTPYKMGGANKNGVDCSNFVAQILRQTLHISFPANAHTQSLLFNPISDIDKLAFGDLIFFTGRNKRSKKIGHVGIYLGNGIFAHSSTGKGVIITHISEGYYNERFRFGGRITKEILNIVEK